MKKSFLIFSTILVVVALTQWPPRPALADKYVTTELSYETTMDSLMRELKDVKTEIEASNSQLLRNVSAIEKQGVRIYLEKRKSTAASKDTTVLDSKKRGKLRWWVRIFKKKPPNE